MTDTSTLRRAMDTLRLSSTGHPVTPAKYGNALVTIAKHRAPPSPAKLARRAAAFPPIPPQEYPAPRSPGLWGRIKGAKK